MANLQNEELLNYLVVLEKAGRKATSEDDNRWGELIIPGPKETKRFHHGGLKLVLFASWKFGYILLETLKIFEEQHPGRLDLVALVTDNPLNPDAKISKKKRIWHILDLPYQVVDESVIIEKGLSHGMQVYTGEIKIPSFRNLLAKWDPDAILVCVFGQVIDKAIIDYPKYGIYNFHPSDLANHMGAGPSPYDDLVTKKSETSVWTVHHISEQIDSGRIVGQSPPVRVLNPAGILPGDPLVVYDKMAEALGPVAIGLAEELCLKADSNQPGWLMEVDFSSKISQQVKGKLLEPVISEEPDFLLPGPESTIFSLL